MQQNPLFSETFEDALMDAVKALKGPKAVGEMLWPDKGMESAAKYLRACLDPERDEKLSLSQILLLAKRARAVGCHTLIAFLSTELDYEWKAVDPESAVQRLQREFIESQRQLSKLAEQLSVKMADVAQLRKVA